MAPIERLHESWRACCPEDGGTRCRDGLDTLHSEGSSRLFVLSGMRDAMRRPLKGTQARRA